MRKEDDMPEVLKTIHKTHPKLPCVCTITVEENVPLETIEGYQKS